MILEAAKTVETWAKVTFPLYNKHMQFQVPQNIAMEDRIVGPLTAIQFAILVVGGFIAYFLFTLSGVPVFFSKIPGFGVGVLTVVLAIGKFNDQPMYRFFKYVLAFLVTPKTRIWHKTGAEIALIKPTQQKEENSLHEHASKHYTRADLAKLAQVVDSRGQSGQVPVQIQPKEETQK